MAEEEVFRAVELLLRQWKLEEATVLLERRLSQPPIPTRVFHDLSVLYSQQGLFDLALDSIERAMERDPTSRAVWHHYLALQKNNPMQPTDEAWKSMHLQFGDTLREVFDARHLSVARSRAAGVRLRVGYLGPDTHNATERFVGPVLERFDRAAFEVFAYWNHASSLTKNAVYQEVHHRSIERLPTERIVELVLGDRIDILVDVAGHGAGNALPTLAYRAAPIQMTWLDYLATTGLETVDYRITDDVADPPGAEARHVEALLRLPVPQWCYRHPSGVPPVTGRRDAVTGDVVFGSICVPLKLSDPLLDLWARLLTRVPGSRLRFLGIPDGRARARVMSFFKRAGIPDERLDILGRLALPQFFSELSGIDIVLDSYPFNGATSTLDALWQGVPVVTLAGRLSHSRSGASILAALGKTQWIARGEDEYLAIAEAVAAECRERPFDRAGIRTELRHSALCDSERFVGEIETAYRESWKKWLRRTESIDSARSYANSRADVLLAPEPIGTSSCEDLLDTLPSHRVTGQVFWTQFRGGGDVHSLSIRRVAMHEVADIVLTNGAPGVDESAMFSGSRPWIAFTPNLHDARRVIEGTLPAEAVANCDALASFGADAMPHGNLLAAGRGHCGGVLAEIVRDEEVVHARLWVPNAMKKCAVLSGPLLLVRRSVVDVKQFRWDACELDFAKAVSRYTFELHGEGGQLGITAALAIPTHGEPDAAAQFQGEQVLARETRVAATPQTGVAASALKAALPAAAWPAFVRRAETFCDHYHSRRDSPSCD